MFSLFGLGELLFLLLYCLVSLSCGQCNIISVYFLSCYVNIDSIDFVYVCVCQK